jgi:8-oxoguanine deaminase
MDTSGCVVTPGLVNAHHHLLQSAFRGRPDAHHVPMAAWLGNMAAAYAAVGVDAELCHAAALVGVAESLLCGVTTVADHHLTWPAGADHVGMALATAAAARSLGARLVFVRGTAGDAPDVAASSVEAMVSALGVGTEGVSADGMVQLAVGPAGVHSDERAGFDALAEVAARHGLRRRTQANEQVDVERAVARFGRRPLELLDEWGWLAPDVTVAHLCGITSGEVELFARSGAFATHAPGCDLPSGWGVAPVGALRAAGVTVGLGTSGGASNDAGHLLADARLAMQVAPLASLPGLPLRARDVLAMMTHGSAAGLGRPELVPANWLDFTGEVDGPDRCYWDVSGVADAGVADPLAGLLWSSPGRRPRHVVVAGEVIVRDGHLVRADERELAAGLARLLAARSAPIGRDR